MKRLIVISVIFALVAGAAFAEINVGGAVFGRWDVLTGTSEKKALIDQAANDGKGDVILLGNGIGAGGEMTRLRLDASGQSDDGTFGGYFRYHGGNDGGWSGTPFGNAWWKPIDQLKLLVGSAGYDGFFARDGVARWGFYRDAGDVFGNIEGWAFGASFYDGFTKGGILTITPLEMLEINIGIPFFDGGRAEGVFKKTQAQVAFNIDGIGTAAVTYVGSYQGDSWYDANPDPEEVENWFYGRPKKSKGKLSQNRNTTLGITQGTYKIGDYGANLAPKIFGYFDLAAIENLGVQLGVGFTLPAKDSTEVETFGDLSEPKKVTAKTTTTYKYNTPLAVGLGVSFDAGAFGIKARLQGQFAEKAKGTVEYVDLLDASNNKTVDMDDLKGPFVFRGDILPSFAINDSMKIFLSAGLTLQAGYNNKKIENVLDADGDPTYDTNNKMVTRKVDEAVDSVVGWHIMPYFTKSVGWCQAFYVGFRLESTGAKWVESYGRDVGGYLDKDKPNEKSIINWSVPIGVAFQF